MTISAKIIEDSISKKGKRLTTFQLRYPKFIHGEFMTHRVFSRNASSSRAIPVSRLLKDLNDDPVYPSYWGANQKGMQAGEECNASVFLPSNDPPVYCEEFTREEAWDEARAFAHIVASAYNKAGYHKQTVNRILEPYSHINVVVTSTQWSNFFALRCHKDAQPEMRLLAEAIYEVYNQYTPKVLDVGEWHLPYVTNKDRDTALKMDESSEFFPDSVFNYLIPLSVARCARVSYLTHEGKEPLITEDLALYDRLMKQVPLHASPAEHQGSPDEYLGTRSVIHGDGRGNSSTVKEDVWLCPQLHGNFDGWIQYRKMCPGECQ